jgi:hypothetical protein
MPEEKDMTPKQSLGFIPEARTRPADEKPVTTPQTDPTNPFHQEAVGVWTAAEHDPERREGVHSGPVAPEGANR